MIAEKMVQILSAVALAGGFALSMPTLADPGKGWDVFNMGAGEKIPAASQMSRSVDAGAGKGWDTFRAGAGEPIRATPTPTNTSGRRVAGAGWDTFQSGSGEKI